MPIFGTDGVRGLANGILTADLALTLAQATAVVLGQGRTAEARKAEGKRLTAVVARDPRVSGHFIAAAVARFSFFEFVILNAHVELWPEGDRHTATARVFMCELRQDAESRERSDAFGLYRDRYVRTEAGWRFARRRYRSMARFPAGDVFPLPSLDD